MKKALTILFVLIMLGFAYFISACSHRKIEPMESINWGIDTAFADSAITDSALMDTGLIK